jgi:hypothetical protein
MNGFMLHVGADTTNLGVVGPIFPDGQFEFIPIDNSFGFEAKTYKDFPARNSAYGKTLLDFLPSKFANTPVHFDPDFYNYTYGQPVAKYPRSQVLDKLKEDALVFFVASLAPYDPFVYQKRDSLLKSFQCGKKDKYVVGFFTVKALVNVFVLKSTEKLAGALLNIGLCEDGVSSLDLKDFKQEVEILEQCGYVIRDGDIYRTTDEANEFSNSLESAFKIISDMEDDNDSTEQNLETGLFKLKNISGTATDEIIKTSHHYRRLKSLDWDYFKLIVGDPQCSCLLTKAIPLTKGFERFSFSLNDLGQALLKRNRDTLRGFRWIDENETKRLSREIVRINPETRDKLSHFL